MDRLNPDIKIETLEELHAIILLILKQEKNTDPVYFWTVKLDTAKQEIHIQRAGEHHISLSDKAKKAVKVPDATIKSILRKLEVFEQNKGFLKRGSTLRSVAKRLNTNTSYLSEVVNTYKHKSFPAYLKELRINYALQELKNNKALQLYTIEAIAQQMGFNNGKSFALAFHKITGHYPSYFIKK